MHIVKKTELLPTEKQKKQIDFYLKQVKIFQNLYLSEIERVKKIKQKKGDKKWFISSYSFAKQITKFKKTSEGAWLNSFPSTSLSLALSDTEQGYKRYLGSFKNNTTDKVRPPHFKSEKDSCSLGIRQTDAKTKKLAITKNAIKVPKIGWIRLKRTNYLPTGEDGIFGNSAKITKTPTGRYFVSVIIELPDDYFYEYDKPYADPIGIDLGLKDLAICSNGKVYGNINKTERIHREERHLKHLQRDLSRKYECAKKEFEKQNKGKSSKIINPNLYKKDLFRIKELTSKHRVSFYKNKDLFYTEETHQIQYKSSLQLSFKRKVRYTKPKMKMSNNWYKAKKKVAKLHERLTNQRNYYIDSIINEIVKEKPIYVAVEDLNVSGMMKNKHLAKSISQQKFYEFRTKLIQKCNQHGIQVRIVDRFYPSSQICSECGEQFKWLGCERKNQMLKVREWDCPHCHTHHDRDLNASINIRNADKFTIATDCELGCAYKQ